MGVGFAELGTVTGIAVAGGLSEMPDCGPAPSSPGRLRAPTVTASVAHEHSPRKLIRVTVHRFASHRNARPLEPGLAGIPA